MFKKEDDRDIVEQRLVGLEDTVKKYVKGRLLGKGGFAKCYQFTSEETGKRYAAKVIEKETLSKAKAKEKLQSEIKIHKSLKHKHIVRFQHFFEDHEYVYILLQICSNQTLNELLKRRKRLTEVEVKYYVYQIALALKYLQGMHVVHRDLKLGNLFLSETLEVKLGDFGLAATLTYEGERRKTVCGTPNYIAPQILENKRGHSYEVDVWSLGVILYALLYGKPPFETNDVKLTYNKIKSCNYSFPEIIKISECARKLISKMLQIEPSKRATLEEILADQFMNVAEIPKSLPRSTLACPPNDAFLEQLKKDNAFLTQEKSVSKLMMSTDKINISKVLSKRKISMSRPSSSMARDVNLKCHLNCPRVWITHFEDNSKFGLCYILNTVAIGMRFNDTSCLVANPKYSKFRYVTLEGNKESQVQIFSGVDFPESVRKKLKILNHYNKELRAKAAPVSARCKDPDQIYVTRYYNSPQAYIFWFNNRNIQAIFNDSTELLMSKTITTYANKAAERSSFESKEVESQSTEIRNRVSYLMEVTKKIKNIKKEHNQNKERERCHSSGKLKPLESSKQFSSTTRLVYRPILEQNNK